MSIYRRKTLHNLAWNATSTFSVAVLQFLFGVVLARILDSEDFGLIGLIAVFTGFAQLFGNSRSARALTQ